MKKDLKEARRNYFPGSRPGDVKTEAYGRLRYTKREMAEEARPGAPYEASTKEHEIISS